MNSRLQPIVKDFATTLRVTTGQPMQRVFDDSGELDGEHNCCAPAACDLTDETHEHGTLDWDYAYDWRADDPRF